MTFKNNLKAHNTTANNTHQESFPRHSSPLLHLITLYYLHSHLASISQTFSPAKVDRNRIMIVSKNNSHATHNTRNHLRADVAGANLNIKLLFFVNENVHCLLMFEERERASERGQEGTHVARNKGVQRASESTLVPSSIWVEGF